MKVETFPEFVSHEMHKYRGTDAALLACMNAYASYLYQVIAHERQAAREVLEVALLHLGPIRLYYVSARIKAFLEEIS